MTEPVEAALDAACETDCFWMGGDGPADADIRRGMAECIAAFHRAIAHHHRCSGLDAEDYEALAMRHEHWAAAVDRAGRGSDGE